eukprot:gene15485-17339_t
MNKEQISDNPEEVKSHYERLSLPDKRGQARYRCKKCGYELICTGRGRLIVHIVGQLIPGTPQKQVKYCGNPDEGLKVALINYMKTDKFHSRLKFKTKRNLLKEVALTPCPHSKVPEGSSSCSSQHSVSENSHHSETVLRKRSLKSSPSSEPPKKYQSISRDSDDENNLKISEAHDLASSMEEMQKEDLLDLLNILRLMDPGKFELALCINQPSSLSRQNIPPVPPMVSFSPYDLISLESSIRLLRHYQLLLQSQNVLRSLGSSEFPNPTLPDITRTIASLLYHSQLFGVVNHESVSPSLTYGTPIPTAATQQDFV